MRKIFIFIGLALNLPMTFTLSAVYDTLPKNVNVFVFDQVMTSKIKSKFDANNQENYISFKENFNSKKLENINGALKTYFQELKNISPEAYNQFSLGEFEMEANAQVSVQGLGYGRGISDHLTLYGQLPIYHAKTNVRFQQTKKSNLDATKNAILNSPTNTPASTFIKQLTLQLPETNEQLLQSLIVNFYGYKPLGNWEKDALGDVEIGGIYRLTNFDDKGLAVAAGLVLPTGDADDPDSLQDVPTGDGQYDAFMETMAGVSFFDNNLQLDLTTRFTYQFASTKILRTIDDPNLPLSRTKELMNEKLGNKIDTTLNTSYKIYSWLKVNSAFIYNQTESTQYNTRDPKVKSALEANTFSTNQWIRVGIGFSSVELYKAKKMDVPCDLNLSAKKLLNAKNSADYERFDLDFRLYF